MRAGRIAGLAAAVHADHRFALAEVDDQPHRRDQPSVEVLAPAVGRYVQRGVVAAGRIGSAIEIALDRAESGALAGAQVGGHFRAVALPFVGVQLAPLPGLALTPQSLFAELHGGGEAAREDCRLVLLLRSAGIVPERTVVAPEQVVGLRRVGEVGGLDEGFPGRAVLRS